MLSASEMVPSRLFVEVLVPSMRMRVSSIEMLSDSDASRTAGPPPGTRAASRRASICRSARSMSACSVSAGYELPVAATRSSTVQ